MQQKEQLKENDLRQEKELKKLQFLTTLCCFAILSFALYSGLSGYVLSLNSLVASIKAIQQHVTTGKLFPIKALQAGAIVGGGFLIAVIALIFKIILRR